MVGATEGWRGDRGSLSGGTIKWGRQSRGYVGAQCVNALEFEREGGVPFRLWGWGGV